MKIKNTQNGLYGYYVYDGESSWIGFDDILECYESENSLKLTENQIKEINDFLDFLNINKINVDDFDKYYLEKFNNWI